jgi:hypothetical protein
MPAQGLLKNRRFILAASLMLVFVVLIVTSRILVGGTQPAATIISDVASVVCALIGSLFFVSLWFSTDDRDLSRKIWGRVAIGMLAWTIAEAIWGFYEVVLQEEVPYPSVADLFWVFGYIPIYAAMLMQYRVFQTSPTRRQKFLIALLVVAFSLLGGVLILRPIVEGFDPQKVLESLVNVAYPVLDLSLLILTFVIIFSLEQGRFSFMWRLIGIGLIFMSLADLMFAYATWYEIYTVEGGPNTITLVTDTLYYVSYLTLGLGAYTYQITSDSLQDIKINIVLRSMTRSNILAFITREGRIISLSDNFMDLVRSRSLNQYVKMPLSQALNVDAAVMQGLVTKTLDQGSLSTLPLTIRDGNGNPKDIWLTSIAVYDEQKQFICIAAVLRANLPSGDGQEHPLNEEQKSLIDYYLTRAGTYRNEENQVIKTYFLEQISLFYSLLQQFDGVKAADRLLEHLGQVASRNDWQFTVAGRNIGIPQEYEGQTLADHLSSLLQEAKSFAVNLINRQVVERELRILDNNLSPDNLRYIDKYDLRRIAVPASS